MTQGAVMDVMRGALIVVLKLAGPLLLASIVVGLIIAIFQAATQIHEQTLTFVPKVLTIAFLLMVLGSWMITVYTEFVHDIFELMQNL